MKVCELFETEHLDRDFIEAKFDGSYWENCSKFVNDNWDREIDTMSDKQRQWLDRIMDDCVEKRIEKK